MGHALKRTGSRNQLDLQGKGSGSGSDVILCSIYKK